MIGYTLQIQRSNKSADPKNIGVKFGRHCIKHNIPVQQLSAEFGVSRQAIYNWFIGRHQPGPRHIPRIKEILGL